MNHPEWLCCSRTAVAIAAAVVASVLSAPALAQNTTSGINGVVIGADGKPAAGAKVTIVHVESGAQNGKKIYVDRDATFTDLPASLAGADWVQIAGDDQR